MYKYLFLVQPNNLGNGTSETYHILKKGHGKLYNIRFTQKEGRLHHYAVLAPGKKNNIKTFVTASGYAREMDIKSGHLLRGSPKLGFDQT